MELTHDCGSGYLPGSLLCLGCGDLLTLERGPALDPVTGPGPLPTLAAVNSDRRPQEAEPACAVCGRPPIDGGATCLFCGSDRAPSSAAHPGDGGGDVVMVLPDGVRVTVADGASFVLGRESGPSEVRTALAAFDAVSRHHSELTRRGSVIVIRDLGSTNGTFVDGMRISEVELSASAVLGLGRALTLHLLIRSEGPAL